MGTTNLMLPLCILEVFVASWSLGAAGGTHGTFLTVPPPIGNFTQSNAEYVVTSVTHVTEYHLVLVVRVATSDTRLTVHTLPVVGLYLRHHHQC